MREDERNGNWFAVESKSFEFTMEGDGKKAKCFITERSRGITSWIRFGVERMNKLLLGVEECCRVSVPARRPFEWRENGRYFRLESKENSAGRFLLCSVTDAEGKRHRLVFPEGRGILNGWTLLVVKIRGLGFKAAQVSKPMRMVTKELSKGEEKEWTSLSKNKVTWGGQHKLKDEEGAGSSGDSAVWLDVGDCVTGKELGSLRFCLVGKWKKKPIPYPETKVMEVWFRDAWRLNEEVLLAALKEDLFLLEFDSPEKAKWVLESGRSFIGGDLQLEWWSPETGCIRRKDLVQEAWIRVVGLPLHLWTPEILRKIGDACGGFVVVDKNTEMKKEVKWARMMIKTVGKSRPRVVNILEGPRSFELQIWWEVSPWVTGVHPVSSRAVVKNPEENEEGWSRAVKRVGASRHNSNDEGQKKQARKTKWGKRQGTGDVDAVGSMSKAVQIGSGGAYAEGWDFKSDGNWAEGEGLTQQAGPGGGSCFHHGLKGADYLGPRDTISKSPAFIKGGKGLKYGLQLQQAGANMSSSDGAERRNEMFGPKPGAMQAGPGGGSCFHHGLKGADYSGQRDTISKSPAFKKGGTGLKYGLQQQQDVANMSSSDGAARRNEMFGPKPGAMQAGPGGGSCFHHGLKGADYPGPRDTISKSPAFIKGGKGLKYGLQLQQAGANMSSSDGAERRNEMFGPKPGAMQAGPGGGSCFHHGLKGADYSGQRDTISKSPAFKKGGKGLKYGLQQQQDVANMSSSDGAARRNEMFGPKPGAMQSGPGGGSCFHHGLKGADYPGPRDTISKSPAFIKGGKGLKYGLQLQQAVANMSSSVGAARRNEMFGPKPGAMQAGPSNWLKNLNQDKKGNWGLKKGFTKVRSGPAGGTSGSSEEWRMKEGGTRPGAEGASNPLADPAWICARRPLLYAKEGWSGRERTSSFDSSWEKEMSLVSAESPAIGGSGQGNGGEGFSIGSSLALLEAISMSPEVVDPKALQMQAKGSRCDTLPSTNCSSPLFSVFGRPLLPGASSGLGDLYEHESLGDMEPLRVVSSDGREWGKGIDNALMEDVQELVGPGSVKGEAATVSSESTGYNNWEDSCLFKFSEYLGVTTVGFEEEILKLMRKMEAQQVEDKSKRNPTETRCERELRKLECTINYSGKSQNRGGRDRGNFLLKLK